MTGYAELQVASNFSFLRGASHPRELVEAAAAQGHAAIAITDRNSLAGVVRAHVAAKAAGVRLIVGARLDLSDGPSLLCYPMDRAAYGRLSRLLTLGKRRAPKGECEIALQDICDHGEGQIVAAIPPEGRDRSFPGHLERIAAAFPGRAYLAAAALHRGDDKRRIARLAALAAAKGMPLLAVNDVHAHSADRKPLQDVLTCIREHCTIDRAGYRLFANAERHLKPPCEMARLFAPWPDAVRRTLEIAGRVNFSLDELTYEYPDDPVSGGRPPQDALEELTWAHAQERFPEGVPDKIRATIEHELALIRMLGYAPYFLTVYDIVRFAKARGILCQGRGSAANSVVCYCLGITAVDPLEIDLLFERFVSAERNEPPDIDVDFEHERREEVIQYIYEKYGRERAGIAATVITYRAKSAIREVGKALGLSEDVTGALARTVWGISSRALAEDQVRRAGLDPSDGRLALALALAAELLGFPRHLSQHVGGFVITRGALSEVIPICNAAMADRTHVEWDKDDLDALGILKIDVLALGMLTCIRKCFELIEKHEGRALALATVPREDPAVYAMLQKADTVGVFQVESRAQMSMLPRLKPKCFYDLVIEVAIVRPGPIQGDMVHPYLRRRDRLEAVDFPAPAPEHGPRDELERVLGKTLGVPLFQEQAMRIAIVAAGFSPGEADGLRRAMATFRRMGTINAFRDKFIGGMTGRGYDKDFAERCFSQIEGFGDYGFPESHAAAFAYLAYVSAWLKRHYPAAFACALLNSQPMGFYQPAQIVRDAQDHGVEARPADINRSLFDGTLERDDPRGGAWALRLGFRQIKGFRRDFAEAIAERRAGGYSGPFDLQRRAGLPAGALERLAAADAFRSTGLDRRAAEWAVRGLEDGRDSLPLFAASALKALSLTDEPEVVLPVMGLGGEVIEDYRATRLSLKAHPLGLLRPRLDARRIAPARRLKDAPNGGRLTVAGLVLVRQRPGTAKGVVFMTLEDETGIANIVVWKHVKERFRPIVMGGRLVAVTGKLQREGLVIHLVAERFSDLSGWLDGLDEIGSQPRGAPSMPASRDFH